MDKTFFHLITIGEHVFKVEIADTPAKRILGLMHRTALLPNHGMLFVMKNMPASFHMSNTHISLDILFFNEHGKIIKIDQMNPYIGKSQCNLNVMWVVELPAGTCKKLGIIPGDDIKSMHSKKRIMHAEQKETRKIESLFREIINEMIISMKRSNTAVSKSLKKDHI